MSQVCQRHRLHIVYFRFSSTVVLTLCVYYISLHLNDRAQYALCGSGVHFGEMINAFFRLLHLHVSRLSVCSSFCFFDSLFVCFKERCFKSSVG